MSHYVLSNLNMSFWKKNSTPISEVEAVEPEPKINHLNKLPYELIGNILSFLDIKDSSSFLKSQNHARTERAVYHFEEYDQQISAHWWT